MKKILIVDDSESVRTQLKRDLVGASYTVLEGCDGVEGLEVLNKDPEVALLIVDVNMPRMDGLTMTKELREISGYEKLPVLIMSTESTQDMKAKGKEVGVLAWITKPYNAERLLMAIEKLVG